MFHSPVTFSFLFHILESPFCATLGPVRLCPLYSVGAWTPPTLYFWTMSAVWSRIDCKHLSSSEVGSTCSMHLIEQMLSVAMMNLSLNPENLHIPKVFGIREIGREELLNVKTANRCTAGQTRVPVICRCKVNKRSKERAHFFPGRHSRPCWHLLYLFRLLFCLFAQLVLPLSQAFGLFWFCRDWRSTWSAQSNN